VSAKAWQGAKLFEGRRSLGVDHQQHQVSHLGGIHHACNCEQRCEIETIVVMMYPGKNQMMSSQLDRGQEGLGNEVVGFQGRRDYERQSSAAPDRHLGSIHRACIETSRKMTTLLPTKSNKVTFTTALM
jgi:hypothetical protein